MLYLLKMRSIFQIKFEKVMIGKSTLKKKMHLFLPKTPIVCQEKHKNNNKKSIRPNCPLYLILVHRIPLFSVGLLDSFLLLHYEPITKLYLLFNLQTHK